MKRRIISIITALALCLSLCPTWAFAVEDEPDTGLCNHHREHIGCGYVAPTEGHGCGHQHTAECYTKGVLPDADGGDYYEIGADTENLLDCQHSHDSECGYVQADPGTPCGYECRICPIEDLIAALPEQVTEDNADDVRGQLDHILDLYRELNEDEQEEINLSRIYALQEALDAANVPNTIEGEVSVDYQEASWNDGVTYTTKTADSYTPVADSTEAVTWNVGWYVVNSSVTISEPITVTGTVNLILADGCTLNAEKGIVVETGNSLTIYAQSVGTGTLNATGTDSAGIGGAGRTDYGVDGGSSGAITIHGGNITATSQNGAGIGGGAPWAGANGGSGSNITIYGGSVTAQSTGTMGGAGIGGGGGSIDGGTGESINIYGGTVNATGGNKGAGIGGGSGSLSNTSGSGTNITISGGTVTAVGGNYAAGIGGGGGYYYSNQYTSGGCTGGTGSVTISGGIVDASSPTDVAFADYKGYPIGSGGNAGDTAATVSKTNAIVFENGAGTVCGDVTLGGSYTVPAGYTLNIPAGASLSGSGTLNGGSAFTTENLTVDMISVPEDWHYTGEDLTEKIKSAVSLNGEITICGQTFTASTDGWELSVEKVSELEYTVKYTHTDKGTLSKTVTIARGQTALSDVVTYKEDGTTPANTFSVGETIIVKATAAFPANNAIMAAAEFDTPTGEQMAVYYNDTQISAPSTVENGVHTMTVDTSNLPESALNKEIGLTVKYIESDNASGATATTNVTVTAVAKVEKGSTTTYVGALADAFTDENSGATVTLLSEVDLGSNYIGIRGSSTFTLDLNGQTVKASHYGAFDISGGSLTIQDSGTSGKIESSNITIEVTGGTLSIKSGTVSGDYGVKISSGTVNISGGTISGNYAGLWVYGGGSTTLSGGTFSGREGVLVEGNASATLKDMLAAGYAYHQNNIPVAKAKAWVDNDNIGEVPLDTKPAWLTGTVTVKECNHTGGLVPSENGYQHGGPCKCCGTTLDTANHTLGAENKCSGCGAELVAKVNDTCYTDFQSTWSAAQAATTATVTLLADVNLGDQCITLSAGNITLTGSGRTLTGSGSQTIEVTGGELIVENVTVKNTNSESHTNSGIHVPSGKTAKVTVGESATVTGSTGIRQLSGSLTVSGTVEGTNSSGFGVRAQGATLIVEEGAKISGGNEGIRHTVGGSLTINGGTINGSIAGVQITEDVTAKLNGGTFTGVYNAVAINGSDTTTMGNLLNTGYAIFKDDGTAVERTLTSTGPGTFTVGTCEHKGVAATSNNNGTHSINCPYCGHTGTATNCAYVFSGATGTCAECGDNVTVAVAADNLIYDGTEKKPGVTVTRAGTELTAGTDYTVAYTDNKNAGENKATVAVTIGNGQGNYIQNFTIGRAALTIKANDQTITYGVSIAAGTDQVTPAGLCTGDTLEGVTLSASSVNVPGGTITPSGAVIKRSGKDVTANYNINYMPGTLTINPVDVKLTFNDQTITYGDTPTGATADPASAKIEYSYTTGEGGEPISGWPTNAGTYTVTAKVEATGNYGEATATATLTISKAPLTIAGATVASKPYDTNDTATVTGVTFDGLKNGETLALGTDYTATGKFDSASAGTGKSVTVTVTLADTAKANNYQLSDSTCTATADITKASSSITKAPTASGITYGQALSDSNLTDGAGSVAGAFSWTAPATKPSAGTAQYEVTFTPTNTNYNTATVNVSVTVSKATPILTAPTASAVEYGQRLSDSTLTGGTATNPNGNAAVAGSWSWASGNTRPTATGTFPVAFVPGDTANYNTPGNVDASVTVSAAAPKITLTVPAYQVANGVVEVKYTAANSHDATLNDLPAVTLTYKVGSGAEQPITDGRFTIPEGTAVDTVIIVTASTAAVDGKYTAATKTATVTVTDKIPVEISGVGVTGRAYNGKAIDHTGTPVIKTLDGKTVTDATVTYTWNTSDGTAPVNAGSYTLTISVGGEKYIGSTTVDFTIEKATVTITAANKSAVVGSVQPELTYTVSGLADGETLATVPTLTCTPDMNTVGSYPITASGAAVPNASNYNTEITYVAGTLSVTAKPSTGGGGYVPSGPGSSTITVPVSGDKSTVHVSASVSGTTATVSKIDTSQIENVIGDNGQASMVEIDFTGLGKTIDTVNLPAAAIKDIAAKAQNKEVGGLTVKLPEAEISFDANALSAIQAQAGSQITLTVTPAKPADLNNRQKEAVGSAPVFDLTLRSSSGAITDFRGGYATVSLPYTLTAGQNPSGVVVYYLDSTGNITPCTTMYDVRSKSAIFTTGHFSLYFVGYDPAAVWVNPFSDVAEDAWYYDAVRYASENGLMGGYGNGKFGPNDNLSRAQFAQILFNKEGRPVVNYLLRYNDVADGAWYTEAVRWATSQGIVGGYGNGMFGPNDNITREQLAVMLWRYAGSPAATEKELHFTDADKASGFALDALRWAVENGVIHGKSGGILDPQGLATRAEVAQMLKNFLGK